jgi:hypothetical protein
VFSDVTAHRAPSKRSARVFNLEKFELLIFWHAGASIICQRSAPSRGMRILNFQNRRKDSIVAVRARSECRARITRRYGKI